MRETRMKELLVANATLQEWGQVIAGSWKIHGSNGEEAGSLSANFVPGQPAVQAICVQPALTGSWTASADPETGQIKHHTINADGSTDVTHVTKKGTNLWELAQVCVLPSGETASNTSSFIVTDGGDTLIQKVKNRKVGNLQLPDIDYVLTRQK